MTKISEVPTIGLTKNTSYELFMLGVSLLSLINLILLLILRDENTTNVIIIIDTFLALLFLVDFLRRFASVEDKKQYFFRHYGWSDLLAAVPLAAFNVFRIFRIVLFSRYVRKTGVRAVRESLRGKLADTALYAVFFCILLLLQFGSIGVLIAEHGAEHANIITASDALWWVFVSITTVGYGDKFPVTNAGRMVGVLTLTVGVGLFGVVTGFVANAFLRDNPRRGQ